jgi:hypothetical protein
MRKPIAFYHYALAHSFLFSGGAGVALVVGFLLSIICEDGILLAGWHAFMWGMLAIVPASLAGFMLGAILIGMPICNLAASLQGWPFYEGDEVIVLTGKRKGTVAKVYEVWDERGQVRLALGEAEAKSCDDVYSALQVTRTANEVSQ